jgi:uncharacterized membrane protein YjjP (DUF1212 family)
VSEDTPTYIRVAGIAVVVVCLTLLVASDGWRTALLAGAAGGAIAATRIRYAGWVAACIVVAATAFIATGPPIGS